MQDLSASPPVRPMTIGGVEAEPHSGRQKAGPTQFADTLHTLQRVQSASKLCEAASSVKQSYEAAASSVGAPMMLRNLISSRDSSRETCIWLIPSSWAMSDCER